MGMVIRKMKTRNLERLYRESQSVERQRVHIPKNPCCEVCPRSRMYKKRTQSKRYDSLSSKGALPEVTTFGERIACDFIIVSKARTEGCNNVVLVVRDESSGLIRAFRVDQRAVRQCKHLLAFLGPSYQVAPSVMMKSDQAGEFIASCSQLGFQHEPTLEGRCTTANSRGRSALLKRCQEHFIYRLDFIRSKIYGS